VACAAPAVPLPLKEQLKVGGRLIIPVGSNPQVQVLYRVDKKGEDDYQSTPLQDVIFVPLVGKFGFKE